MKDSNFTKVSNPLIRHAKDLGISNLGFRVIITVLMHARKDRLPYPSNRTVAEIMGTTERTVQRASEGLQKKGYLKRPRGGTKPYWDFTGLFEALERVTTPTTGAGVGVSTDTDNLATEHRQFGHATQTNPSPNTDNLNTQHRQIHHPKKTKEDIRRHIKEEEMKRRHELDEEIKKRNNNIYTFKKRDSNLSSESKEYPVHTSKIEQNHLSTNERPSIDEVRAAHMKWLEFEASMNSDEAQTSLNGDKLVKPSEDEN